MICTSWTSAPHSEFFDTYQSQQIKDFFTSFVDLPSQIHKNYLYIISTLHLIKTKKVPRWIWSQGGFEHKNFHPKSQWNFEEYRGNESIYNLWDYYNPEQLRPYYHVDDPEIIKQVCMYYKKVLQLSV
jgi:hypothetical protein